MTKAELRSKVKSMRNALINRAEMSDAASKNIITCREFLTAKTILTYRPFCSELDITSFNDHAAVSGKQLCYPMVIEQGIMVAATPKDGRFVLDRHGISSPNPLSSDIVLPADIDMVIVPCVALDRQGWRLGYGGGYYDRYLPQCVNAVKIGVIFSAQFVKDALHEAHDSPLDAVVTELEKLYFSRESSEETRC